MVVRLEMVTSPRDRGQIRERTSNQRQDEPLDHSISR